MDAPMLVCVPAAGAAHAGECPSDKRVADGQGQKPGPTMPKDVTDVVRASTDLSKEPKKVHTVAIKPDGSVEPVASGDITVDNERITVDIAGKLHRARVRSSLRVIRGGKRE